MNNHASTDKSTWARALKDAQLYGLTPYADYYAIIAYAYVKADGGNRRALATAYPLLKTAYENWYNGRK